MQLKRRRHLRRLLPCLPPPPPTLGPLPFLRKFTTKEIKRATNGFSMIITCGSHGTIYRANFPNGKVAAVRKTKSLQHANDTFYREVRLLGCLHHRHLVKLQGFSEGHERFLVFEHTENGSLKEYLQDPLRTPLSWRTRLQIAINVAAALEYLYNFCDPPVYNVSIKSSNVLLDENFVAKVSDVGLLECDCSMSETNTRSKCEINHRSTDVMFQFGVLILELITGQSFVGQDGELIQWVQDSKLAYSMHKMVDADLGDNYDSKELKSLLIIARLCTRNGNDSRISIPQIHRYLQGKF